MRNGFWRCRAIAALFLLLAVMGAAGSAALADPNDVVPRGDVTYDQLGSLAAAGFLPGYSLRDFARGDRLYTRDEIAAFVGQAGRPREAFLEDSPYAAALRALRLRFAPELRWDRDGRAPEFVRAEAGLFTLQTKARVLSGPAAGSGIGRASLTLPVGRDGFAAVSLGNWRDEWHTTHRGGNKSGIYPLIETAFVRVNGRALDVSVGTSPLRWGPGYFGTLLLGDESVSVPRVQIEKDFRFPGQIGRRLGRVYFSQFLGQFFEFDDQTAPFDARGSRRYLAGRRLELRGGPWTLTVAEAIKSTRLPSPQWAMLLPSFLEYQNEWSKSSRKRPLKFLTAGALPDTFWLNYVGDAGISYRADRRSGATLYGDLLIDDIKALKGQGVGDNTPRKVGFQLGAYAPRLDAGGRYGLRLEYARLDSRTYTDISPPIEWTQDGVPLGYAGGSGIRSFSGRLDTVLSPRVKVAIEAESRTFQGTRGIPAVSPLRRRIGLYGTYDLRRDLFVGARIENRTRFGSPSRNRVEVNVGYGF